MKKREYKSRGGAIGTGVGAIAGSIIPGVGTGVGATVGGAIGSLFGKKAPEEPKPPITAGNPVPTSYGLREGGAIPSMQVGGRSHEAGGVDLSEFGRPDVEVERGESIMFDALGDPGYVFSAMRMKDAPRTFAEEFERLKEKGDLEAIRRLQMKQEEQMGRKKNVTMSNTLRQAQFAKYGGSIKKKYAVGGSIDPPWMQSRTFYGHPGGGVSTELPARSGPRVFQQGPAGTRIGGLPTHVPQGSNLPVHQPRPVPGANLPATISRPNVWGRLAGVAGRGVSAFGAGMLAGHGINYLFNPAERQQRRDDQFLGSLRDSVSDWEEVPEGYQAPRVESRDGAAARRERERNRTELLNDPDIQRITNIGPRRGTGEMLMWGVDPDRDPIEANVPEEVSGTTAPTAPERPRVAPNQPVDEIYEPSFIDILGPGIERSHRTVEGETFGAGRLPERRQPLEPANVDVPDGSGSSFNAASLARLAPYAADLFNIGVASRMRAPQRPRAYTPALMDDRVSTTQDEATLTTQARAILANPNATSNQKLAAMGQLHRARSGVRSQANVQRDNIRRHNVQSINRAREVNQRIGERHADREAQFRGARASAVSAGVRSISDRVEREAFNRQAMELEPFQLTALMHSMNTQDRREFIRDLKNSLPPGHRLHQSLQTMLRSA